MKLLPSWIRLARFNCSSFTIIRFICRHLDGYRSNLTPGLDRLFKADARVVPGSRPQLGLTFTRVLYAGNCSEHVYTLLIGYRSGGTPGFPQNLRVRDGIAGRRRGSSACQRPSNLPALRVARRCSPALRVIDDSCE